MVGLERTYADLQISVLANKAQVLVFWGGWGVSWWLALVCYDVRS